MSWNYDMLDAWLHTYLPKKKKEEETILPSPIPILGLETTFIECDNNVIYILSLILCYTIYAQPL